MVNHEELALLLVEFARNLVRGYDIEAILSRVCEGTAAIVGATGAGVMLEDEQGDLRFVAASDEIVREIEDLQIEFGEGPCLHSYHTGEQVVVTDLATSDHFPRFGPKAVEAGLRAVYSFPMGFEEQVIGALNLYDAEPGVFGEDEQRAGQTLADISTSYLLNARSVAARGRLTGQLQRALDSRIVIEQAKGRLAERLSLQPGDAFEILRRHARNHGLRLHDVARDVAEGRLHLEGR
jgi:GAF domain-containing protein